VTRISTKLQTSLIMLYTTPLKWSNTHSCSMLELK